MTAALFIATVLIWGTTWIAIAFELGEVPVVVSIFFRFALAAVMMIGGLAVLGKLKRPHMWRFVVMQALCLFCFNFIGLYSATALIPSGLVSVVFSLASIFNVINALLFFKDPIRKQSLLAGAIGVVGLTLLFWEDIAISFSFDTIKGVGLAMLGTLFFSFGNMASRRNSAEGISPVTANAWGMAIGASVLLLIAVATGQALVVPTAISYWVALIYLAAIGSVAGFTFYLMLVARAGSARAGYATVLFPVIALCASTIFEGFVWSPLVVGGILLTVVGNVVMFQKR